MLFAADSANYVLHGQADTDQRRARFDCRCAQASTVFVRDAACGGYGLRGNASERGTGISRKRDGAAQTPIPCLSFRAAVTRVVAMGLQTAASRLTIVAAHDEAANIDVPPSAKAISTACSTATNRHAPFEAYKRQDKCDRRFMRLIRVGSYLTGLG
jgi:hypothetical protein